MTTEEAPQPEHPRGPAEPPRPPLAAPAMPAPMAYAAPIPPTLVAPVVDGSTSPSGLPEPAKAKIQALYNLAVAHTNLAYHNARPALPPPAPLVSGSIAQIVEAIDERVGGKAHAGGKDPAVLAEAYCNQVLEMALAPDADEDDFLQDLQPSAVLLLGCIRALQGPARPAPRETALRALQGDRSALDHLRSRESKASHLELVTWTQRAVRSPNADARYNAACYWSKVYAADEAFSELAGAVANPRLRTMARDDPALEWLRTSFKEPFDDLIPPAATPITDEDAPAKATTKPAQTNPVELDEGLARLPDPFDLESLVIEVRGSEPIYARGWIGRRGVIPARLDLWLDRRAGRFMPRLILGTRAPIASVHATIVTARSQGGISSSDRIELAPRKEPDLAGYEYEIVGYDGNGIELDGFEVLKVEVELASDPDGPITISGPLVFPPAGSEPTAPWSITAHGDD